MPAERGFFCVWLGERTDSNPEFEPSKARTMRRPQAEATRSDAEGKARSGAVNPTENTDFDRRRLYQCPPKADFLGLAV